MMLRRTKMQLMWRTRIRLGCRKMCLRQRTGIGRNHSESGRMLNLVVRMLWIERQPCGVAWPAPLEGGLVPAQWMLGRSRREDRNTKILGTSSCDNSSLSICLDVRVY
jgi:hypothetical protein